MTNVPARRPSPPHQDIPIRVAFHTSGPAEWSRVVERTRKDTARTAASFPGPQENVRTLMWHLMGPVRVGLDSGWSSRVKEPSVRRPLCIPALFRMFCRVFAHVSVENTAQG